VEIPPLEEGGLFGLLLVIDNIFLLTDLPMEPNCFATSNSCFAVFDKEPSVSESLSISSDVKL